MGFRLRKRIRLAPGIRLTIGLGGVSASVGPRGASLTMGRRGVRANVGLPGTGVSYSTRLDGGAHTSTRSPGPTGRELREARYAEAQAAAQREEAELEAHLGAWRDLPVPSNHPATKGPPPDPPAPVAPTREAVQARLQMAAERDVAMLHPDPPWARAAGWAATGLAVAAGLMAVTGAALEWAAGTAMVAALAWGVCRWLRRRADARRQSAVTERVEAELESAVRAAQQAHDEAMRGWKARSEARRARWERLVRNVPDAVDDALEDAFAEIEFPFETSAEFDVQGERIDLAVDFPEIEDLVPETRPKALKKGGVRRVKRKRADRRHMYAESIAGLSVMLAATALSAAPGIRAVRLAGYTQRKRRGSSAVHDDFIVHAVFERDALASIEPTTFDPLAFLEERPEAVAFDRWGKFRRLPRPDWISEVP